MFLGCRKRLKSRLLFFETNRKVEKLSEMIVFVIMKIALQCSILPKCIASIVDYFITDLGRDSFELPFPFW